MTDLNELIDDFLGVLDDMQDTPRVWAQDHAIFRDRQNDLWNQIQLLTNGKASEAIERRREELNKS